MDDKAKYLDLMQRYIEAETSPEEEKALIRYVASTDDSEFDSLRGLFGFLSVGKRRKVRRSRLLRQYVLVAAASIAAVIGVGTAIFANGRDKCSFYAYGEEIKDNERIMANVDAFLTDFFKTETSAEASLIEMFNR